jgi:ubiquinone/menaquinone biosynthesis C-methylase UbiE
MTALLKMPRLFYQVAKVKLSQVKSNQTADYDKAAISYDDYYSQYLGSSALELWKKLPVKEGQCILDLACGTGFFTSKLATKVGQEGKITAVDLSTGMLQKNKEKALNKNLTNIDFIQSDALAFLANLSSGSFDGLVCGWGICYMNHSKLSKEIERVLKPGGFLGIIENRACSLKDVSDLFTQVLMDYPQAMTKNIDLHLPKDKDYLIKAFCKNNLEQQEAWNGEVIIPCTNGEQVADYMLKSGASAGFINALRPDLVSEFFQTFIQYAEQRFESQNPVLVKHDFCALLALKN